MPVIPYTIVPSNGSDSADEWMRLGFEAQTTGNLPLAQTRYQQALRLDPRHSLAMNNLAVVYATSNLLNEALLTIERAALCDGVHGVIQRNWSIMEMDSERVGEAMERAGRAVILEPDDVSNSLALAMISASAGKPQDSVSLYNRILDKEPTHGAAGPNSCFVQTLTDATPADLLAQRQRWHAANGWNGTPEPHTNDRDPDRPLRVGYVSGDFKSHSAAIIFARVLFHHSPQVEMYLYSTLAVDANADGRTKRFMDTAGNRWRDIAALSDDDAANLIRKDRIDILVDLAGHTNGGRLALFTRRPAPIQVTAWGFAHGTGLPEIDYFFADTVSVPEEDRQFYSEKVVNLPCLVTMEPIDEYGLKGTSSPPIRKNGYFTFGSYARYEKLSDSCLATFAEILRRVPDAKLEFKDHALKRPYSIRRILAAMPDIAPDRLLFSIATTHPDHLLAYQQCDIALDPWPHCGGVVSLEQLWMGVPVLTMYGNKPSGRNTSSVLTAMGRPEWIAKSPAEYVDNAVEWSERIVDLASARKTLREELLSSPVVAGYPEAVENRYREFWKAWCEK